MIRSLPFFCGKSFFFFKLVSCSEHFRSEGINVCFFDYFCCLLGFRLERSPSLCLENAADPSGVFWTSRNASLNHPGIEERGDCDLLPVVS